MSLILSSGSPKTHSEKSFFPITIAGIPIYVFAVSLASVSIIVGFIWDICWHMTIGRDKFFSPPHVLVYLGAVFGGLFSGMQVLWNTFRADSVTRSTLIKIWGYFYSSLGALFCIWGAIAMLTSAPLDNWWHETYGLDIVILSPPHALLGSGMLIMMWGSCVSISRYINLLERSHDQSGISITQRKIFQILFILAASSFLCMNCTLLIENISTRSQHHARFYKIVAATVLILLPAFGRPLRLKWGITSIAIAYLLILGTSNWILQQFPAEPKLGPILNPVTYFQPLPFPILFFIPAIAMDIIMWKAKHNDWIKAVMLSSTFVVLLFIVQYPLSRFLFESPLARNKFFGSASWLYSADPDWAYRFRYTEGENQPVGALTRGLLQAVVIGTLSARTGLRLGKWMASILR